MKKKFFKDMVKIDNITNKEKLGLEITVLVLIFVIMFALSNINQNDKIKIDYDSFSIENEINGYNVVKDAQKYYDVYEIISNYLTSYNVEINASDKNIDYTKAKYTRKEYYSVLSQAYKRELNKKEYMGISEKFCRKFIYVTSYGESVDTSMDIIGEIKVLPSKIYGSNMFVCSLNTRFEDTKAYIGIHLDEKLKIYDIFYIE